MIKSNKKISIITLGCPKNQVDSEVIASELVRGGVILVGNEKEADTIIINTCGFIEAAKKESIDTILKAVKLKKDGRDRQIVVCGCLSQRYKERLEQEIPEVDAYFGVESFNEIGSFILGPSYSWNEKKLNRSILSTLPHTAYLKIADGCNHGCSFCAIPMIKGPYRSRSINSVIDEAQSLVDRGVKELILIAQDTTAYGSDQRNGTDLICLLERLVSISDLRWIRIMYAFPDSVNDRLIDLISHEDKICKYLDIPFQHISDSILRSMGRKSRKESIELLISKLRNRIPNIVIRTTFIVGFPGETDTMFQELVDFVKHIRFERMGAFIYSPEEGTAAYRMRPAVPRNVAEERYHIIMNTQREISAEINRSLESKSLPVIVDGYDENEKLFFGRTQGDAPEVDQRVWIKGKAKIGGIVNVKITASSEYDLLSEAVE